MHYLQKILPSVDKLREAPFFSSFETEQFQNSIVNIDGELFVNTPLFIISNLLDRIDWSSVDAIFVSTVGSYLLLPVILRNTNFGGAIYAPYTTHSVGTRWFSSM